MTEAATVAAAGPQQPPMRRLLSACPDFETLRFRNAVYVDKTAAIGRLAAEAGSFMLVRPRRFGKSLLVSTLAALFSKGLREFGGLALEKTWTGRTHRVARLDFSLTCCRLTPEAFLQAFEAEVRLGFSDAGFVHDPASGDALMVQLDAWLEKLQPASLVVLVDEYDAPLAERIEDPRALARVWEVMAGLYDVLGRHAGKLRFFLMTGIIKPGQVAGAAALDFVTDVSMAAETSTLLGFTESETAGFFGDRLEAAAPAAGYAGRAQFLEALIEQYGGFCFDARARGRVCAPWSVLHVLKEPERGLSDYWVATGGWTPLLARCLQACAAVGGGPLTVPEQALLHPAVPASGAAIEPAVLLTQTGYLTIRGAGGGRFALGWPNREVAGAVPRLMTG